MASPSIPPLSQTLTELDRLDGKEDGRYGALGPNMPGIDISKLRNDCSVIEALPTLPKREGHEHQRLVFTSDASGTREVDCKGMAEKLARLNGFAKQSVVPKMTVKLLSGQFRRENSVTPDQFLAFTMVDGMITNLLAGTSSASESPKQSFERVFGWALTNVSDYARFVGHNGAKYTNMDVHGAFAVFKAEFGEAAEVFRPDAPIPMLKKP